MGKPTRKVKVVNIPELPTTTEHLPTNNTTTTTTIDLPKVTLTMLSCKFCSKIFNDLGRLRRHELVDCKKDWTTNYYGYQFCITIGLMLAAIINNFTQDINSS